MADIGSDAVGCLASGGGVISAVSEQAESKKKIRSRNKKINGFEHLIIMNFHRFH
ncbi:MAG: hypothetical protein ABFD29_07005 [Anaerolineaceae bacterium]